MQPTAPEEAVAATDPIIDLLGPSWIDVRANGVREGSGTRGSSLLACRPSRTVHLHEAAIGAEIPPHGDRRRLHDELVRRVGGRAIVIFTDAAHSAHVWCWTSTGRGDVEHYLDIRVPPRRAVLLRSLRGAELRDDGEAAPTSGDASTELVAALTSRLPPAQRPRTPGLAGLVAWIDGCDEADELRRLWRLLRGFVVVVRGCEVGAALLAAAHPLERIYLACLDRMRSWVDDSEAEGPKRRPEYLSDFKRSVEVAESGTHPDCPESYVRRLIAQRNLCGLATTPIGARVSRAHLLSYVGAAGPSIPSLDVNVRLDRRKAEERAIAFADVAERPEEPSFREPEELCRRTLEILREARLKEVPASLELRRAAVQLERRRRVLEVRSSGEMGEDAAAARWTDHDLRRVFLLDHVSVIHRLGGG